MGWVIPMIIFTLVFVGAMVFRSKAIHQIAALQVKRANLVGNTYTDQANRTRIEQQIDSMNIESKIGQIVRIVAFGLMALWTLLSCVDQVSAGNVGVRYSFGKITGHSGDGSGGVIVHLPWETVRSGNVQVQNDRPSTECSDGTKNCLNAFSSESQDVYMVPILNIKVEPAQIQTLYTQIGPDYVNKIVMPEMVQITKEETVKYAAKDIAPNRAVIATAIRDRLTAYLSQYSITVKDFTIQNIGFTKAFQQAIDEATTAEQNATTQQANVAVHKATADQAVADAKGQADSAVTLATGQAQANKVLSESLTPEFLQYVTIQKLGPDVKVIMLPSNQGIILNAGDLTGSAAPTK